MKLGKFCQWVAILLETYCPICKREIMLTTLPPVLHICGCGKRWIFTSKTDGYGQMALYEEGKNDA